MKLNHLNLTVLDVTAATEFFETHFDFKCSEVKGNNRLSVLRGEDGFILVISNLRQQTDVQYPTDFHLGFLVDTPEQVQQTYQRLKAGGVALDREPAVIRGALGFYFSGPGNVLIEISCAA